MSKLSHEYNELDTVRHSCAHVMAHAIKELYPDAKFGVGPAIENGFYYDVVTSKRLDEEDLRAIETKMAQLVKENKPFVRREIPRDEALKMFAEKGETFKVEIINGIDPKDNISTYSEGEFTDLCRGPHVESSGKIKAFKLLSVSGAYWRGSERNPMMQRIYGTAFLSDKDLRVYLNQLEEAKKRDHRRLGKELKLFSIEDTAGPGLVFFHPKGAMLRHVIESYVKKEHAKRGYQFVMGPQILRSDVWKISGHYGYYKENMFIHTAEDEKEYAIKPMNCPGHMLIYKTETRSYRDFPIRFFEMGNVCRNEKTGALHGLLRVRNFTQDDAHIFCMPDQLEGEIASVLDFVFEVLHKFGFEKYEIDLSLRPKDSIGTDEIWKQATDALRGALERKGLKYKEQPEGGAFYGPKIDVRIKDALGREWQCSTIQCDFALPERFELEYVAPSGKKERPVMIHRAILGSVERFMGTLIEHYAGAFPFWLSPIQVGLLPVSEAHEAYAREVEKELKDQGVRTVFLDSSETLGKRIRNGQAEKIPYLLVVGDKEAGSHTVTARRYGSQEQTAMAVSEFLRKCSEENF